MKRYNWYLTLADRFGGVHGMIIESTDTFHSQDIKRVVKIAESVGLTHAITITSFHRLEEVIKDDTQQP